jgi:uncharacterized protein (TIGR02145 family)
MRKLIFILLFPVMVWGQQVPDNTTFNLDTVVKVVNPSSNDLNECFNDAVKSYFNVLYDSIGYAPVRSMLRFRDYGAHNVAVCGYGLLYNWYAATDERKISSSDGWRLPTDTDVQTLLFYLDPDGTLTNNTAGENLKESGTEYWASSPYPGNNSTGFNGRGSGLRLETDGTFQNIKNNGVFWTSTFSTSDRARTGGLYSNSLSFLRSFFYWKQGLNIRLLLNDPSSWSPGDTYTGNDGQTYKTVKIGTQVWLAESLRETKYRDGSVIPEVTDNAAWAALTTGALCAYNNDWSNACMTRPAIYDLMYYYKFNDSGTTISEVMQSYNMTVTGDSAKALSPGKLNTAYKFKSAEANTNKIYHSSAVTTANYDTLTLSYWLKVDTLPTFDVSIYSSITGTGVIGPLIRLKTGGRIDAGYKWSGGASTSSGVGGTVTVGAWHNITIVWWYNSSDGNQYVKGYKDGVFVSSGNGIVTPTTPLVSYGFEINIGPFGGIKSTFTIDDFKIWKRELNITEIGINYNGGIGVEF